MGNEAPSPYGVPPEQVPTEKIVGNIWIGNELTQQAIAKGAVIENPTFRGISPETSEQLKAIIPRLFPAYKVQNEKMRRHPDKMVNIEQEYGREQQEMLSLLDRPEIAPHIQAAVVRSKDKIEGTKRLWYLMPGVLSAAAQYSPTAANIFSYMNERPGVGSEIPTTSEVVAFSSKAGIDTADQRMPRTIIESASYQATFMLDLLKERKEQGLNVPEEIVMVSHSIGGHDSIVAHAILEELLKANGFENTRIAALIMVQPSGMFDMSFKELLKAGKNAWTEFFPLKRTVRTKYPLPDDIKAIESRMDEAQIIGNDKLAEHLTAHRDAMLYRIDNPPDLTPEEAAKYSGLFNQLKGDLSESEKDKLKNDMYKLLFPAIKRIAEGIRPGYWNDIKNLKGLAKFLLGAEDRFSAVKKMPLWMQGLIRDEDRVAVLSGGGDIDDEFFSADLVKKRIPSLHDFFLFAHHGISAVMYNWSHADYPNRPHDFTRILGNLTEYLLGLAEGEFAQVNYYLDPKEGIRADVQKYSPQLLV